MDDTIADLYGYVISKDPNVVENNNKKQQKKHHCRNWI